MQENTWSDDLIAFLLSARSQKIYRNILWEKAKARKSNLRKTAFNQYLYRLYKKRAVINHGIYLQAKKTRLVAINSRFVIKNVEPLRRYKLLVSFDIPQIKSKTRDWLRNQIKFWDFEMIHQSLWLGYGPLPKEFYNRLKNLRIEKNVRIFRIVKSP
ncbi:MAG: hypothetical protein WCT29_03250 [Candidatus Paceibacterota bacterium]|jgi:hypothetical protein